MTRYYTARQLYLSFNGTPINTAWTQFALERTLALADVTPLGSTDRVQRPTIQAARWSLEVYDDQQTGGALLVLLQLGASGTLVIGPQGNATGAPKLSFDTLITAIERPFTYEDTVKLTIRGVKIGPMLHDDGATF